MQGLLGKSIVVNAYNHGEYTYSNNKILQKNYLKKKDNHLIYDFRFYQ